MITLGRGEPDIPTPAHIVAAAKEALDAGYTTYTNPAGLPALREAIAEKFRQDNGLEYDPASQIIVTTGAQEALAVVMQTLLDPGDEVILAAPFYMAYEVEAFRIASRSPNRWTIFWTRGAAAGFWTGSGYPRGETANSSVLVFRS